MKLKLDDLLKIAVEVDQTLYGKKENADLMKHLKEEVVEFNNALNAAETTIHADFEQLKELGDMMFCIVSIAHQNDLDLGHALSLTITKLQERIKHGIKE